MRSNEPVLELTPAEVGEAEGGGVSRGTGALWEGSGAEAGGEDAAASTACCDTSTLSDRGEAMGEAREEEEEAGENSSCCVALAGDR